MRPGTKLQTRLWITREVEEDGELQDLDIQVDLEGIYTRAEPDIGLPEGAEEIRAFNSISGAEIQLDPQELARAEEALLCNGGY